MKRTFASIPRCQHSQSERNRAAKSCRDYPEATAQRLVEDGHPTDDFEELLQRIGELLVAAADTSEPNEPSDHSS